MTSLVSRNRPLHRHAGNVTFSARALAVSTAATWALAIGIAMSTQHLFQPFVWANWPWDGVLLGCLEVVRDRVVVALAIGLALAIASRLPTRSAWSKSGCVSETNDAEHDRDGLLL